MKQTRMRKKIIMLQNDEWGKKISNESINQSIKHPHTHTRHTHTRTHTNIYNIIYKKFNKKKIGKRARWSQEKKTESGSDLMRW